jgi:RNA polymerase sigma-70 factor (ECF subfamily)
MDAEDAVQETFLKAYKKLASFDGRSSFGTWLYRVTANTSIDVLRRRRRESSRTTSLDDDAMQGRGPVTGDPAPDRLLYNAEMNQRIHQALDELTELERSAFVMRHFENFRLDEIGRALGLGTSATKQAVFRAVKKVRKALEPALRTTR